jgi:hypothetical protein
MASFQPVALLLPGTEYYWWVRPGDANQKLGSSNDSDFFTGPVCGQLYDPKLNDIPHPWYPAKVIADLQPEFFWREYLLHPENSYLDTESILELSGPNDTVTIHTGSPSRNWTPQQALLDRTPYSWRVADRYGKDQGPWSQTASFFTNTGNCQAAPTPTPPPQPPQKKKTPVPNVCNPPYCVAPYYAWHQDSCICETVPHP